MLSTPALIVWSDEPDEKGILAARTRLAGQCAAYALVYMNCFVMNLDGPPLLSSKSYLRTISQLRPGSDALRSALAG